jgi:hypothetical protein
MLVSISPNFGHVGDNPVELRFRRHKGISQLEYLVLVPPGTNKRLERLHFQSLDLAAHIHIGIISFGRT